MAKVEGFDRSLRVKKRKDFLTIQRDGKKTRAYHFLLSLSANNLDHSRLGITVTTKVDKSAVCRNKLKRRIRDLFRRNKSKLKNGFDGVVIALQGATDLSYKEIEKELCFAVRKAGILHRDTR